MSTNEPNESSTPETKGGGVPFSVGGSLRAYFLTGILVTAPISITIYLAWLFVTFVDEKVTPIIPAKYHPETYLPFSIPGLGLLIVFIFLTVVGMLTAGFLGRFLIRMWEGILAKVPVIRGVYGAVKQILETVLAQQSEAFREAVLVEYPRRGIWAIAFITGKTEGEVQNITEEECINIFLPTTPNPTSGFLLFVPKKELIPLSMSVEEAVKMVISGGIVTPPDRRSEEEKATPIVSAATFEDMDVLREHDRTAVLIANKVPPGAKAKKDPLSEDDDAE